MTYGGAVGSGGIGDAADDVGLVAGVGMKGVLGTIVDDASVVA